MDQTKLNADYQAALNSVFGGTISLRGKYLNPRSVIKHHCQSCKRNFFAKPLWLVNKRQLHECHATVTGRTVKPKPKKATTEKPAAIRKVNYSYKVNEEMRLQMILLYRQGGSLKSIARQFEVSPPTVKKHILKAGVKLRA